MQGEEYAVNIGCVTEIVGVQRISVVPDVPEYIKGVINLRGKVIQVMDVRLRFRLDWREYGDRMTIIVLDLCGVPPGLVVDQVTDVLKMLSESSSSGAGLKATTRAGGLRRLHSPPYTTLSAYHSRTMTILMLSDPLVAVNIRGNLKGKSWNTGNI
ncbi:MAG: chemotaxis protein CheW [Chloroflexota bacterium]|nr:chemotaxis protein CheW [Chloroflexota bacterium]